MSRHHRGLQALMVLLIGIGTRAQGDVLSYTTKTDKDGTVLTSVTVKRGKVAVVFDPAKLIRAQVTYFRSSGGTTSSGGPTTSSPATRRAAWPA